MVNNERQCSTVDSADSRSALLVEHLRAKIFEPQVLYLTNGAQCPTAAVTVVKSWLSVSSYCHQEIFLLGHTAAVDILWCVYSSHNDMFLFVKEKLL